MATDLFDRPSEGRLLGFCLLSAVTAFAVVVTTQVPWLLLPVAILVLALLSVLDGYWQSR